METEIQNDENSDEKYSSVKESELANTQQTHDQHFDYVISQRTPIQISCSQTQEAEGSSDGQYEQRGLSKAAPFSEKQMIMIGKENQDDD